MVAEKLDLLMNITNTKNSTLGRALAFDPSYISRIRTGKRGLPKNQPFLEQAAEYFVRALQAPYQKAMLAEAVTPNRPWPDDAEEARALLLAWLSVEDSFPERAISRILSGMESSPDKTRELAGREVCGSAPARPAETIFYYGNNGKRRAVETFLSDLCALGTPQTLFLYSDEDMSWLYEDGAFSEQWARLLLQLISNGAQLRIIHTISRGMGDMLEAVQKWLPLYITGAIHPYFYPKLRDGICRRTLFIAHGHSALTSNSIGVHTQAALNLLTYDHSAVQSLETEFMDYFALCRPLMRIFDWRNGSAYLDALTEFENSSGNLITALPTFSHFTMPASAAASIADRLKNRRLAETLKSSAARLEKKLAEGYTATEILHLPTPEAVRSGTVRVPVCGLFSEPELCYTAEEFINHLEHVMALLRGNKGYNVLLSERISEKLIIFSKEDTGTIVARSAPPTTVFGISEQNMTAAFWEFLNRLTSPISSKDSVLCQLSAYLKQLG